MTVHRYAVRSPLNGCQVTLKPRDRFSRYTKCLDNGVVFVRCGVGMGKTAMFLIIARWALGRLEGGGGDILSLLREIRVK